jgi:hypothetical protein
MRERIEVGKNLKRLLPVGVSQLSGAPVKLGWWGSYWIGFEK